uniref:Uncharacterized protein n=1 Tax=Meloidogyne javanica TaxID=6303 RepID=A0A915ME63_MELJA
MNGVEFTNILPHMKVNLRSYLINNANTALINARNRLHEVVEILIELNGTDEHIVFDDDASNHHNGHAYGNGHANVGHLQNYFTQELKHFGYAENKYIYKIKWQNQQSLENVEYIEIQETNDGNILAVYQSRTQQYNINN